MSAPSSSRPSRTVTITGTSVLTPLADDIAALAAAIREGRTAIADAEGPPRVGESRFADFDASRYANVRGMRVYDRATRLGICAVKRALESAGIAEGAVAPEDLGIVVGATYAHLDTLLEYDKSLIEVGLARTNPAWMPLALPSAPGAAIALSFGAKAFAISLANGCTSSLDALGLAARMLESGRARVCIVVGAASLSAVLTQSASRAGVLAMADAYRPLDRSSRGTVLGEGAAAVVLERTEDARARGLYPDTFVVGRASTFASDPDDVSASMRRAIGRAVLDAGVSSASIAAIEVGASGIEARDRAEAEAVRDFVADLAAPPVVSASKATLGETTDASGLFSAILLAHALRTGEAQQVPTLREPVVQGLRFAEPRGRVDGTHGLVTSTSSTGGCSALVLEVRHGG